MSRRLDTFTVRGFFAASVVIALIACGAPLEGAGSPSASSHASAANPPPPPTSPMPSESAADPICGAGWRWDGVHCVAAAFGSTGSTEMASSSFGGDSADGKAKSKNHDAPSSGPHVTIEDIKIGTGAEAHDNSHVRIHYVGKLADGTTFDSSRDRNEPFSFTIGIGEVIRGFDQGVTGMKVGGLRRVQIPPALGYGRRGAPPKIPPDATLKFEIELLGVE